MQELTPEEVKRVRQRKTTVDEIVKTDGKVETSKDKFEENLSGTVKVEFESMGRFSIPDTLYFKDYSTVDINNIIMSSQEDLIANLVPILNGMVAGEEVGKVDCANMTLEEFTEVLLTVKGKFNTLKHIHPYMCDCQYDLPEADQKMNEGEVNLTTIQYKSIEQVEDEIKLTMKENLGEYTDEEWSDYQKQYSAKNNVPVEEITKQLVIDNLKIKEPFGITTDSHEIELRFMRVADIVKAQKMLDKEYSSQFKRIQNRTEHGVSGEDLKIKKQKEVETLQKEKAKKLLSYVKAFSIVSIDGRQLSDAEKVQAIENRDIFPRRVTRDIDAVLDQLKHGIYDEREFTCPYCGKLNKESLQYDISITELLPINSKSERDNRHLTRLNIRFGA